MAENNTDEWATGVIDVGMGVNGERSLATNVTSYQGMICRPTRFHESNWLDADARKTAKLRSEDNKFLDDEYSINTQIRTERLDPQHPNHDMLEEPMPFQERDAFSPLNTTIIPTPVHVRKNISLGIANTPKQIQASKGKQGQGRPPPDPLSTASAPEVNSLPTPLYPDSLTQAQIEINKQFARESQQYEDGYRSVSEEVLIQSPTDAFGTTENDDEDLADDDANNNGYLWKEIRRYQLRFATSSVEML